MTLHDGDDEIAEGASSSRLWAAMAPDALAHIFRRLPLRQLLTIIPCVCKPWKLASLNPLCYQTLNLQDLHPFCEDDSANKLGLTEVLLARSQGCLLEISYSPFMNHLRSLYVVARSAPLLQKLHIPRSCADNEWATYAAPLMPHIVDLDISMCDNNLSHEAIEAFGKSCKHMRLLRRNRISFWPSSDDSDDSEAVAIAQYYPCLEHLELRSNPLSNKGLQAILDNCPLLGYLDLTGCNHLQQDSLFDKCQAQVKVVRYDFSYDYDDYYDIEGGSDNYYDDNDGNDGWFSF